VAEAADVIVGVIAHLMALIHNLLKQVEMFPHVVAHHEEGGFDIVVAKGLKNERRRLGNGTIVERQVNCMFGVVHSPVGLSDFFMWFLFAKKTRSCSISWYNF